MISTLLALDTSLLLSARWLVGPEYAHIVAFCGETIVVYGALVLLGVWFAGIYQKKKEYKIYALEIFFTIVLTFVIYTIVNLGIPQWRISPQEVAGAIDPLIPHPIDNSFPSGHALFTAWLLVWLLRFFPNRWLIFGTLLFGLLTAGARVIGGIHYPGDILGGWFFGTLGAMVGATLVTKPLFQKRIFPSLIRVAEWMKL